MLKKMGLKKIMVSSFAVLLLLIIYLMPENRKEITLDNTTIEYNFNNIKSTIYLIDQNDYVSRTSIASCNCSALDLAKDLTEGLIIDGKKSNIIPNGFRSIIPPGVEIIALELKDKILTIDFSKEILDIQKEKEEKMIEAIIYTLTNIDGIDKVIIKVEGKELNTLPSGKTLPSVLDKSYGINKNYDLVTTNNIKSYTVFYTANYNNNKYYVPVTKYVNSKEDDIVKVVIKELSSSPIYETNLMSYLNANTELLDYELEGNKLKLNFNNLLFNNTTDNKILEEVIYVISLSMDNIYNDLKEVSFYVDSKEIYTFNYDNLK